MYWAQRHTGPKTWGGASSPLGSSFLMDAIYGDGVYLTLVPPNTELAAVELSTGIASV